MRWFAVMGAVALVGCKADLECVAHVECGAELRCIEGSCQPDPDVDMAEPDAPEPDAQPDPNPMDMALVDLGPPPDLGPTPDMGPDLGPPADMGPEPGPDRELFQRTILGILNSRCASCHANTAAPNDGDFTIEGGMFNEMYEEVQEFLNLSIPAQS
ncbi:MAG: hypothetical protein ACI9U2_004901, partial [Bradymonadia bacterium]